MDEQRKSGECKQFAFPVRFEHKDDLIFRDEQGNCGEIQQVSGIGQGGLAENRYFNIVRQQGSLQGRLQ